MNTTENSSNFNFYSVNARDELVDPPAGTPHALAFDQYKYQLHGEVFYFFWTPEKGWSEDSVMIHPVIAPVRRGSDLRLIRADGRESRAIFSVIHGENVAIEVKGE